MLRIRVVNINGVILSERTFEDGDGGHYMLVAPHALSNAAGMENRVEVLITGRGVQEAHERLTALEARIEELEE